MKKFYKLVAVLAVAVMVFGCALTASATASTATVSATASDVSAVAAQTSDGTAVTVTSVPESKVVEAQKAAVAVFGKVTAGIQIEKCFELTATISGPTTITIAVPNITAGQKVAVLHQKADGTWESVPVVSVSKGAVAATFTSLSPVAIISYTSPKTGETLPVAGIVCVIALAGAAVCCKKFVLN